jgi:hypothetical protein
MTKTSTRTRLLRACYSFLVPVARFLLRNGVGFREFAEISRVAFVEVAGSDYGIRGRPTNISRVSAMTGIGRKEVRRIRQQRAEYVDDPRVDLSPLADVLQRWFTDPSYLNSSGNPKTLPFRNGQKTFTKLVKECAGDVPAGAIKVELIRCGAIAEDTAGKLTAKRRYVVPEGGDKRIVTSMAFGLRALASTIAHNVDHSGELGRIERFIESDPLTESGIAGLRSEVRKRITAFADGIDDYFSAAERSSPVTGRRVGVGIYFYEDD